MRDVPFNKALLLQSHLQQDQNAIFKHKYGENTNNYAFIFGFAFLKNRNKFASTLAFYEEMIQAKSI